MKPKPDSLKEEIEKIITNIFDRVDNSTWKEARDQATAAILEVIKKRLPEKQVVLFGAQNRNGLYYCNNCGQPTESWGSCENCLRVYNQCLEDIRKELK